MKKITKEYISEKLNNRLEDCLSEIYCENNIKTGDITPAQSLIFDKLVEDTANLFMELIHQNSSK